MWGLRFASLLILLCALSLAARADTLYTDGDPSGTSGGWVIDHGWEVQDSFTLTSASVLTGVTFGNQIDLGTTGLSVDWIIVSTEGSSTPACAACFGTAALTSGAIIPAGAGLEVDDESFSLPSLDLASGTYWLGLQNEITSNGDEGAWDINGGPSDVWHSVLGDLSGSNCKAKEPGNPAPSCASSFAIIGNSSGTPEPNTFLLLGSALALVTGIRIAESSRSGRPW